MSQPLITVPVTVFEVQDGVTVERGTGACSIVGQRGAPPRYKLVCFDDQRNALCTATLTGSNEHSIRFTLQTAEYASFYDDDDVMFSVLFLRSTDVDVFLANLGAAFYGAAGQPTHSTVIADFAHASKRTPGPGNEVLELGKRGKVRYAAFEVTRGETSQDLPLIEEKQPVDTSGDLPYAFEAVQTAYTLPPDGRGFESSVLGMIQETWRVVVVPDTLPRNSKPFDKTLVFIVFLKRVVCDPTDNVSTALVEAKATARSNAAATRASNAVAVRGAGDDGPPRPVRRDHSAPGSGIPAEHMLLVQKVASQVNAALSSLKDLQDKVDNFNGEWKQSVNRPKPSVLPNAALEQNLRNLINENERAREELERREELMRAIEDRNRDLQKRVDKAAQLAQTLMDEKKKAVSQTSDMRLEMDRQNMRLQEQITQAQNERDDLQRHLDTVKKLLQMSDDALKDTRGKMDIVQVQVRGTGDKLDAAEEQLGEERTRRKAFEAKVAALQEELRNAMAEVKLKSAELDDVTRKVDADRVYHQQLMEDDRERRSIEAAQLRSEIVTELQNRETKFQADRARVSADNFERGREEGIEIGRRNARIDLEHRMQELQLEAQRTKTELDAYKTQLRDTQDDALAENRRLEAAVTALKGATEEATKSKAKNEFMIHSLRMRVKHAEDALLLGLTTTAHRLSHTIEPTDLLEVLDRLHAGEMRPPLDFEAARLDAEAADALARRERWMCDTAAAHYESTLQALYDDVVRPVAAAFADLNADVARLWYERDMRDLEQVIAGEASVRHGVESDEDGEFSAIVEMRDSEIAAQRAVIQAEEEARPEIVAEYDEFAADLMSLIVEQACERQVLVIEHESDFAAMEEECMTGFTQMREAFERIIFEELITAQQEIMGEEDQARIAIADEESGELDAIASEAAAEASSIRDVLAEREKEMRAARSEAEAQESRARVELEMDEDTERGGLEREMEDTKPRAPTPPPAPALPPPSEREEEAPQEAPAEAPAKSDAHSDASDEPPTAPPSNSAPPMPPAQPTEPAQQPVRAPPPMPAPSLPAMRFEDSESDVGSAPSMVPPMPRPKPAHTIPSHKAISNPLGDDGVAAAAMASDSESDEGGLLARPAPKPAAKRPAAKPAAAAALFADSDDDDAAPAPVARPKPAAKPAANLFADSDEDDTPRMPRPKPAAKPGAKPAPKRAALFGSDSD